MSGSKASRIIEEPVDVHVSHVGDLQIDTRMIAVELDGVSTDLLRLGVLEGLVVVAVSLPVDDGDCHRLQVGSTPVRHTVAGRI